MNSAIPQQPIAIDTNRDNADYLGTDNLFSPRVQLTNTIMNTEMKKEIGFSKNTIITENINFE